MPLTVKQIENLKPTDKRQELADGGSMWFVLEPSGSSSYVIRYRNSEGRLLKYKLGSASRLTLKQARSEATIKLVDVAKGGDPQSEKVAARRARSEAKPLASDLIDNVAARFLAEHVRATLRPRTVVEVERHVGKIVKAFAGRRLSEIKRAEIREFIAAIKIAGTPVTASHCLNWFKGLCSWAIEEELIEASPAAGIKSPATETPRERILTHGEVRVIWKAAQGLAYPNGTFVQMLMLSGQRRREVSDMTWRELDLPHRVWTLPAERSKNGKAHLVPLSDAVIELLEMIPRAPGDTYVFSFGNGKPLNDFDRIKRQLDAVLPDLPHWTLHDLRRTMRTELGRLGIRPDIAERCICHLIGSTVSRTYDRHEYFQKKAAAMNRWAQELNAIVHGRLDAKVVSL